MSSRNSGRISVTAFCVRNRVTPTEAREVTLLLHSWVESRRGAVTLASRWRMVRFSPGRLSPVWRRSVSSSRSSNWTGAFRASSSRRKVHGFAHGKLTVRPLRRTSPNLSCRSWSEYRLRPAPFRLCLARSHWRSLRPVCRSTAL